jgi:hypothetical protein
MVAHALLFFYSLTRQDAIFKNNGNRRKQNI